MQTNFKLLTKVDIIKTVPRFYLHTEFQIARSFVRDWRWWRRIMEFTCTKPNRDEYFVSAYSSFLIWHQKPQTRRSNKIFKWKSVNWWDFLRQMMFLEFANFFFVSSVVDTSLRTIYQKQFIELINEYSITWLYLTFLNFYISLTYSLCIFSCLCYSNFFPGVFFSIAYFMQNVG